LNGPSGKVDDLVIGEEFEGVETEGVYNTFFKLVKVEE
jgi:hypothetical protein